MAKDTLLKRIRNRKGLSSYAVAKLLNEKGFQLDQSAYFRIEQGDRGAEIALADEIARMFGVKRDVIFNPDSFRAVSDEVIAEEAELEAKAS